MLHGVRISKVMLLMFSYIRTCFWCQIYPEAILLVLVTHEHAPWWQNIQVMLLIFSYIRTCSWCQIYPEAILLVLVTKEHAPWCQNIQVMLLLEHTPRTDTLSKFWYYWVTSYTGITDSISFICS